MNAHLLAFLLFTRGLDSILTLVQAHLSFFASLNVLLLRCVTVVCVFFFNPSMNESEYQSTNKNRKHLLVKFVELLECNVLWKRVEIGHGDRLLESWRDFVSFLLLKLTICSQSCSYESLVFFNFDGKNISIEKKSLQTYKRIKTHSIYTRVPILESFTSGWMEIHYYLN